MSFNSETVVTVYFIYIFFTTVLHILLLPGPQTTCFQHTKSLRQEIFFCFVYIYMTRFLAYRPVCFTSAGRISVRKCRFSQSQLRIFLLNNWTRDLSLTIKIKCRLFILIIQLRNEVVEYRRFALCCSSAGVDRSSG